MNNFAAGNFSNKNFDMRVFTTVDSTPKNNIIYYLYNSFINWNDEIHL